MNTKFCRHMLVSAVFLSITASYPTTLFAANAFIEEVVVTARKQEESAQDVPIAITALTAELENSSVRNLTDINGYSPNVIIGEAKLVRSVSPLGAWEVINHMITKPLVDTA